LIAAVFAVAGENNETAVRVVQAFIDTFTCLLIALIVFEISRREHVRRQGLARWALFLSAICPFSANYAASILTEVPMTFLWTVATLFGIRALKGRASGRNWFYCGLFTGGATLFRPESPLLLGIFLILLILKERSALDWRAVITGGSLMGAALLIVLLPWTVRNGVTLKTFQPLAPRYAQDEDEYVTAGYFDWCKTWLWTYRDVTLFLFPLETEDIRQNALPASATHDQAEREKVLGLIRLHNREGDSLSPESDREFAAVAAHRRAEHPLRYYVTLPFLRSVAMWFTPRTEILNLEGKLVPISEAWENDPIDFVFTSFLFLVNLGYISLAACGLVRVFHHSKSIVDPEFLGCLFLVAIIAIRTVFFAYFAFPEPRYVLESYPELIASGAFTFIRNN